MQCPNYQSDSILAEALEAACTDKTRLLIINYPNNPMTTYNVDNRERRLKNYYITATHNARKKLC